MRRFARISCALLKKFKASNIIQNRLVFTTSEKARPCLQLEWEITKETIFHNLNCCLQKRGYAPNTSTNHRKCWNCKKFHSNGDAFMQCQHCGFLQDVERNINYFGLFNFPQKFDFDAKALKKRFWQLQTVVHPDKFSNKTSREQSNSADWSSLINNAYKTLSIPLERGQYLLEVNGLQLPQNNSALDKQFLMEMMERNEEVENARTRNELIAINERLSQQLEEKLEFLSKTFSENNFEMAKALLIEMKYLISVQKTIKNKLQILG